ncbi:redoxin domain-containing protein [Aeromicrobium fastidiosum]|uniref:Redoxin domain-containing protein n=1 Tax=Aeromicrobium fastidiosum TaxID=52699 RepID=A0A641AN88_9ACTN|nr:redoxin domain-containing protein [Aeromicrobium fastidiosum]KAA1378191.1 redoxin domain-containing protein [Aeromicrobium fastidiosum]MBP2389001.1 thiol-disulfide isomerase/thioredoxin [Aeromicrobium fastidiosum]
MSRLRQALRQVLGSRRALGISAALALLVVAALVDVPGRLAAVAPSDPAPSASPSPSPISTGTADRGRLSNLTNADNQQLDQCPPGSTTLARCGTAPPLGPGAWLNTPGGTPVSLDDLRGSVVLVDFFSSSCINCRRASRYLNEWQQTYGDAGLRIVGVHSAEFAFEKDDRQLARTLDQLAVTFPVLQDQSFATLTDYRAQVLPSTYLVDATGTVRAISIGEGGAVGTEELIRRLLVEGDPAVDLPDRVGGLDDGEDPGADTTPQINLGASDGRRVDGESDTVIGDDTRFRLPPSQPEGTFSFGGLWTVGSESSSPRNSAVARVSYRGRSAYQLVAGDGTLVVTTSDGLTRQIVVDGPPQLLQLHVSDLFARETLTVRYEGELQVYAFSFG